MANENNTPVTPEENQNIPANVPAGSEDSLIMSAAMEGIDAARQQISDNQSPPAVGDGVTDKFKGLPMRELISAPLIAVCEAQQQLAATALNFYDKIAFDGGKTRLLEFDLERPVQTPGGVETNTVKVKAPFIGLVPIPSLLIEHVDIDFQMEVTDTSSSKQVDSAELTTDVSAKWFKVSVSVQGKVGTSRETTRSTNQTAKYQVHVTAAQQRQTEGLSKLMDIMASCIEPIPQAKA